MAKTNLKISDNSLKALGIILFILWSATWLYTAWKMTVFSAVTYRNLTLPASLICLDLWAICFAVSSRRRFSVDKSPMGMVDEKQYANMPAMARFLQTRWLTPFFMAGCISVIFIGFSLFFHSSHPSWPSPVLPAMICFSPMVFFFAGTSTRTRGFQDKLAGSVPPQATL